MNAPDSSSATTGQPQAGAVGVSGASDSPPAALACDTRQLHRRFSATAVALARTEEQVAATFERIAQHKPRDAERLHDKAAQARQFAARLRLLATRYDHMLGSHQQ